MRNFRNSSKIMLLIKELNKTVKNKVILKDITLHVKQGEVFGFLGPNGAGKSTTMKIATGLLPPSKGTILVNSIDITKQREAALKELSALIETPKFYPYLTGLENLKQLARLDNISYSEINEAISLLKLEDVIQMKVKTYSLGTKQKLGIAQAIMGNKKLLILDEPTNGLDADSIINFRHVIKNLVKEKGTTVFISSHKLDEIEKLCTKVAFIKSGEIKSIEDLNNEEQTNLVDITTPNVNECIGILNSLTYISHIKTGNSGLKFKCDTNNFNTLIRTLVTNDIYINNIETENKSLEDRYIELLGE